MFSLDINFNFSLILFLLVLGFYLWYTFIIVYHLIRFGVGTKPKNTALIFLIGSFVLFSLAVITYLQIDWGIILK